MPLCCGIDFGTTYSAISWYDPDNRRLEVNILADQFLNEYLQNRALQVGQTIAPPRQLAPTQQRGTPVVPGGKVDRVQFSVTAPSTVHPGASFVVNVWAHFEDQRQAVIQRAREAVASGEVFIQSKGLVQVVRGTMLTVSLRIEGLGIDAPEDTILWEGDIGNAIFPVFVPLEAQQGPRHGLAIIRVEGIQIAKIHFTLLVGKETAMVTQVSIGEERHHKAFASYASADRDQVLPRVQGIQKVAPSLDIFLDVLTLRSGQYWEQELWQLIPKIDIFYLFWSENAKRSVWVEKEWRCALTTRGIDFIDPIPLVSPEEVPPPLELASKHFDDWTLAFRRSRALTLPQKDLQSQNVQETIS
jgi:hypothetical protein